MRKLVSICLLVGVLAASLGVAASISGASEGDADDGCLVTRDAKGLITISLRSGFVLGRFDSGQVTMDDLVEGDTPPRVYGTDRTPRLLTDTRTLYKGENVRFRANGRTIIHINAVGVYVSAVGKGTATLWDQDFELLPGDFSVDAASFCTDGFQPMPQISERFVIGGTG